MSLWCKTATHRLCVTLCNCSATIWQFSALTVSTPNRLPAMPTISTFAELDFPKLFHFYIIPEREGED